MKRIITIAGILFLLAIMLMACSNGILRQRTAATSFSTISGMYGYEFRFMKLTEGSIPADSRIVIVGDSTLINFEWRQRFESVPYDSQVDPDYLYGVTNDTTSYFVLESGVFYDDGGADIRQVSLKNDIAVELDSAPYGVQIRSATWNPKTSNPVWSKYSDMIPFFAHVPIDPPARAINLMILE